MSFELGGSAGGDAESRWDAAIGADFKGSARLQTKGHQGQRGTGRRTERFCFRAKFQACLRFHLEFTMDFMLVAVQAQMLDMRVGLVDVREVLTGKEGRQALLPEGVFAFDLALGLRCGGVTKAHAIEVQGPASLSEGLRIMGEEETMVIDIEFQRQSVFDESGGQQIEVSEQGFALV